jgi:hypothetical protein
MMRRRRSKRSRQEDRTRNEVLGARVNLYMVAKKWDMAAAVASHLVKVDPQTAGSVAGLDAGHRSCPKRTPQRISQSRGEVGRRNLAGYGEAFVTPNPGELLGGYEFMCFVNNTICHISQSDSASRKAGIFSP